MTTCKRINQTATRYTREDLIADLAFDLETPAQRCKRIVATADRLASDYSDHVACADTLIGVRADRHEIRAMILALRSGDLDSVDSMPEWNDQLIAEEPTHAGNRPATGRSLPSIPAMRSIDGPR